MSKMSDIHAAASEIDTTDAEAVQALADSLAAERYAPDVARYADTVARIIERRSSILYDGARVIADEISTTRFSDRIAIYADAVRRAIESMDADACYSCGDTFGRYVSGGAEHCEQCHAAQSDPA